MGTENLVSVIVPAYNSEKYISECVLSVLGQTHAALEVIVVNDASTDGTVNIVESLIESDNRVRLLNMPTNSGGPAKPRNKGLTEAQGHFVAFIDSDDIWQPEKLEIQVKVLSSSPFKLVSCGRSRFQEDRSELGDPVTQKHTVESGNIRDISYDQLLKKNIFVASGVIMAREIAEELHFSELPEHVAIEDYLAWLGLLRTPHVLAGFIDLPLVRYRVRPDSLSRSKVFMAKRVWALLKQVGREQNIGYGRRLYYFGHYVIRTLISRISAV